MNSEVSVHSNSSSTQFQILNSSLVGIQLKVPSFLIDKVLVFPLFNNGTILNHKDLVGLADGAQAVGNDEGGPSPQQAPQTLLDKGLTFGIEIRGCLIQNQNPRIRQYGAGNGNALPLPPRKFDTALSNQGIEAFLKTILKLLNMDRFQRRQEPRLFT